MARFSVSLAAAPQTHLAQVVAELEAASAEMLHLDIEDGRFVPMMNLGTKLITDLRLLTKLTFDVHLMMVDPEWILPELAAYGADRIAVHWEACAYPRRVLRKIKDLGIQAGLAFNPATPLGDLAQLRPYLDYVILLSTEPEGPDAPFLPGVLRKLETGRNQAGLESIEWVLDGGIKAEVMPQIAKADVDTVVVGRAVFASGTPGASLERLRQLLVAK